MLALTATTDNLEVDLDAAHTTTSLKIYATWRDLTTTAMTPGRSVQTTNGTTEVVAVAAPAASTQRIIDTLTVFNEDTVTQAVTVKFDANGTEYKIIKASLLTGEMLMYTDGVGWQTYTAQGVLKATRVSGFQPSTGWTQVILSSDQTNNNGTANTMEDVTGLSFSVVTGNRYMFRAQIFYTAAATTTGSRWSVNGPAATTLAYQSIYSLTATSVTMNYGLSAYDLPAASNATSATTGANFALLWGFLQPSADGTLIVRHASEILSSAIVAKQGSVLEWIQV